MPIYMQTFLLGVAISAVFTWLRFPVPVTPSFAGFMGIAGLFVGFILMRELM